MLQATDIEKLAVELGKWQTWAVLGAVTVAGLLGGLARKLTADPADAGKSKWDAIVGAITALAMLMVVPVQQLVGLLGMSIVSGFAGKSILDALRARAEAIAAKEQASEAKTAAAEADTKRKEAVQKGLAAVKKAQEITAHTEDLTTELSSSLTPDLLAHFPKTSRFVVKGDDNSNPIITMSTITSSQLASLEDDLMKLM